MSYHTPNTLKGSKAVNNQASSKYAYDKQVYSDMIDKAFNDKLKDITTFDAVILQLKKSYRYYEVAGVLRVSPAQPNEANYYEVCVRPKFFENIPAPWTFSSATMDPTTKVISWSGAAQSAVDCHPLATSATPYNIGQPAQLQVGDTVRCTFTETESGGRKITFELSSVGREETILTKMGLQLHLSNFNRVAVAGNTINALNAAQNQSTTNIDPKTLKWTGVNNAGKLVTTTPQKRKYIGIVAQFNGKDIYNGLLPDEILTTVTHEFPKYKNGVAIVGKKKVNKFKILTDAANSLSMMNAAYKAVYGHDLPVGGVNRSWETQKTTRNNNGRKASLPGNSNHGWALAIDFKVTKEYSKNGKSQFKSDNFLWLKKNAPKYGWEHPSWAAPKKYGGTNVEAWHFEYKSRSTILKGKTNVKSWSGGGM